MILEDLIAYKSSERDNTRLFDILIDDRQGAGNAYWEGGGCIAGPGITPGTTADVNILNKWSNRFSQRRLGCNPAAVNTQRISTYIICRDNTECSNQNNDILERIYFGKIEITFGDKSKNLYFRIQRQY